MNEDAKIKDLENYISEAMKSERSDSQLIAVLHKAQELFGYLSKETMEMVSQKMSIPSSHIWGVATFYHFFNLKPRGKHSISVCLGTACYIKGADAVLKAVKDELKIGVGETTEDKIFTLHETRCVGTCGLAPVMMVDDKVYGELTPKKVVEVLRKIKKESK